MFNLFKKLCRASDKPALPETIEPKPQTGKIHRLPTPLFNIITSYSDVKDAIHFAHTSHFHYNSTKVQLDFKTALQLIVDGVPEIIYADGSKEKTFLIVKQILEAHSKLNFLKMRGTVINKPGDTIENATLLQAAWGEDDEELCELILSKFGELSCMDEARQQIRERFPEEPEETKEQIRKRRKKVWNPITAAVDASDEEALVKAHKLFRKLLKSRVIKQGKHFLHKKILAEAVKIYLNKNWLELMCDTDSYYQCMLFVDYIFGYLQRKMPACYAEVISEGTHWVRFYCDEIPRSLKLKKGGEYYDYSDSDRDTFYYLDSHGVRYNTYWHHHEPYPGLMFIVDGYLSNSFGKIVETKAAYFKEFNERLEKSELIQSKENRVTLA